MFRYYFTFSVNVSELSGRLVKPDYEHFESDKYCVPNHLLKYLNGSGWHFAKYFDNIDYPMNVDVLAETFPSWEKFREKANNSELELYWTEEDHNNFKELVDWFAENSEQSVLWPCP